MRERPSNRLLTLLSERAYSLLAPQLRATELTAGMVLHHPGAAVLQIYFFESGAASILGSLASGDTVEVAMIGPEGCAGAWALDDDVPTPWTTVVQLGGEALVVDRDVLVTYVRSAPTLERALIRYSGAMLRVAAQLVTCNRFHDLGQRCARTLLMLHDRAEADTLRVTHELLSRALGTHRQSVSVVLEVLARDGRIDLGRGRIRIADRVALETVACECYAAIREYIDRLTSPPQLG